MIVVREESGRPAAAIRCQLMSLRPAHGPHFPLLIAHTSCLFFPQQTIMETTVIIVSDCVSVAVYVSSECCV